MTPPPPSQLPTSSQSLDFWSHALEAVEELERPPSPPRKFVSSLVSPDTSEIGEEQREYQLADNAAGEPANSSAQHVRFAEPASPDAEDDMTMRAPFLARENDGDQPSNTPPPIASLGTTLTYLPHQTSAEGSHAYLSRPEYAANKFGDIASYMKNKDLKVQRQNAEIAAIAAERTGVALPQIFASMTFYINGNTTPPMEVLRGLILQHGGKVVPFLRRKTEIDYVVAPVLTLAKFKDLQNNRVVKEGFVTQSCEEGRVVDWRRWILRPEGEQEQNLFAPVKKAQDSLAASQAPPVPKVDEPPRSTGAAPVAVGGALLTTPLRPTSTPKPVPAATPATGPRSAKREPPAAVTRSLLPPPSQSQTPRPSTARQSLASTTQTPTSATDAAPSVKTPGTKRPEGAWENYHAHKSNHQAAELMKSEVFRRNHTSEGGNKAGFIDQYYQNSRLHHLSTWKAELRVLVANARAAAVQAPTVLTTSDERVYFHVDFDAFFVSAGLVTRPHLRGRPVVVCHSSSGGRDSTSEVASASYEARAKGVRNGMSLGRARQLVGDELETIPYDFQSYKQFSAQFYTVLLGYADELEAVSVDEALIDVTSAVHARALAPDEVGNRTTDPAIQIADKIRDDIRAATGCEVSIGISHNILLARIATGKAKPAGVHKLTAEGAVEVLTGMEVDQLPSVGRSMRSKIEDAFSTTQCGKLLSVSKARLQKVLGPKTGDTLYGFIRGKDTRRLQPDKERKSVSAEMNYGIRFKTNDQAGQYVRDLAGEVTKRLVAIGAKGRHITLKIMTRHPDAPVEPPKFLGHGYCETVNRSAALPSLTNNAEAIADEAVKLFLSLRLDPTELRGVGIQITKLVIGPGKGQSVLDFKRPRDPGADKQDGDEEVESTNAPPSDIASADLASTSFQGMELVRMPPPLIQGTKAATSAELLQPRIVVPEGLEAWAEGNSNETPDPDARQDEHVPVKRRRVEEGDKADIPVTKQRDGQLNPAAFITKQLRPHHKTQMSAKLVAELPLYSAWSRMEERDKVESRTTRGKARETEPIAIVIDSDSDTEAADAGGDSLICGIPASELRALGIDLDFFAALPDDMRDEVLATERERLRRQRESARRSATLSPRHARRSETPGPGPAPAGPTVYAAVTSRPSLFGARTTDDVATVLTRWVTSRPRPADADLRRVSAYLAKSAVHGLGGVEHVSALLRCVRGLLTDMARRSPCEDDEEVDIPAWWEAWGEMKLAVEGVLVDEFGAGLRL